MQETVILEIVAESERSVFQANGRVEYGYHMSTIKKIVRKFEDSITIISFLAMTLVVFWSVLCRYVLKIPFTMGEELARYLMIYSIYFGVSIGVRKGSHLGIKAFVDMLPQKVYVVVEKIEAFATALMFAILFVLSIQMVLQFKSTGQVSTMMRIPMYIVYLALPIGFAMSIFHSVENIVEKFRKEGDL